MKLWVKKVRGIKKYRGLMFKSRKTPPLLFEFDEDTDIAIHSWFVFYSFLALWLDKNNNVLEGKIIRPFKSSVQPYKKFRKLIEIPYPFAEILQI